MRPKVFALCAAGLLLASVTHCASAQDGGGLAPLISSGRPSSGAAAGPTGATSGARRMLSDDEPSSEPREEAARLRDQPLSPRNEPAISDQSWTSTRTQSASSLTQSSRSGKHLIDGSATSPRPRAQQSESAAPLPLPAAPPNAEIRQPVPSPYRAAQNSSDSSSPWQTAPSQTRTARGDVQTAGDISPSSGASHLRSHVTQAQFTSSGTISPESPRDGNSQKVTSDEHRPLKPPTASVQASDEKRSTGTVQMFVSVVSSLLIVVGLLLGAAWCYRKATPNLSGSLPKQALQVLGRTPLAPRQQLILVRFGPKLVLMSNLQGEVRTLSEIVDPLEVDRICGMCESSQAGSISDSFRTVLHNIGRTG